jgi:hypothetical protein
MLVMMASYVILFGCLGIAIILVIILEGRVGKHLRETASRKLAWIMIISCYGVCIGVVSLLLGYFFHFREWLCLVIAVPVGIPAFFLACKMAES